MLLPRSLPIDARQIVYGDDNHSYDNTLPKSTVTSLIIGVGTFAVTSLLVVCSLRIYLRRRLRLRQAQNGRGGSGRDMRDRMREYPDGEGNGGDGRKPEMWEVEMKYEDEIMQPLTLCDPTYIRAHLVQPGISKSVSIFIAFPAPSSEPDKLPEIVLGTTTFNQSTSSSTISRYSENEKIISRNTSEEGDHIMKSTDTGKGQTKVVVKALEYV
ncbi:hypothetical protein I315_01841 [Cryptococcus gattii Ru294]|nr:hypothetical protein I315_01841 [Cryptococcus gattii Ru294]